MNERAEAIAILAGDIDAQAAYALTLRAIPPPDESRAKAFAAFLPVVLSRDDSDTIMFPTPGGGVDACLAAVIFRCFLDRLRGLGGGISCWIRFPSALLDAGQVRELADRVARAERVRREESDPRLNGSDAAPIALGYFGASVGMAIPAVYTTDDDVLRWLPSVVFGTSSSGGPLLADATAGGPRFRCRHGYGRRRCERGCGDSVQCSTAVPMLFIPSRAVRVPERRRGALLHESMV